MISDDEFTNRLSDYVDADEIDAAERARIDAHLRGCVSCRAIVRELQDVKARALALTDSAPSEDLWPGIAERIGGDSRRLQVTPSHCAPSSEARRRWPR